MPYRTCFAALSVILFCSGALAAGPSNPFGPPPDDQRYQLIAVWYGSYWYREYVGTGETGVGFNPRHPACTKRQTIGCVIREEYDTYQGGPRSVLQSCDWSGSVSDIYYKIEGNKEPGGIDGSRSESYDRSDDADAPYGDPQGVERAQKDFDRAFADEEQKRQAMELADAAYKTAQEQRKAGKISYQDESAARVAADHARSDAKGARDTCAMYARYLDRAKSGRQRIGFVGGAQFRPDQNAGVFFASAHAQIPTLSKVPYTEFRLKQKAGHAFEHVVTSENPRELDWPVTTTFSAEGRLFASSGELVKSFQSPNNQTQWFASFHRVAMADHPIAVRGTVMHRIRCTAATQASYLVGPLRGDESLDPPKEGQASTDPMMEGVLPVDGKVLVEAWIFRPDPNEDLPPRRRPDIITHTIADGRFELFLPKLQPEEYVWFRFTYSNHEAHLCEISEFGIAADQLTNPKLDANGQGLLSFNRTNRCAVRYDGKPRKFELGRETRGGVLRKKADTLSLNFDGPFSVFMNNWVLRSRHINQNLQEFAITAAVPREKLIAMCPPFINVKLVKERLGGQDNTSCSFPGGEICFPTSTLMALYCIGLETPQEDNDGKTNRISSLGQEIYDFTAVHDRVFSENIADTSTIGDDATAPPWLMSELAAVYQRSLAADALKRVAPIQGLLANLPVMFYFQGHWPYAPDVATSDLNTKKWLATLAGAWSGNRPWQVASYTNSLLKKQHAGQVDFALKSYATDYQVFNAANAGFILRQLAQGCPATVSIRHRNSTGGEGGHVLCLLGAVITDDGVIERLIFHDPYGDLTQHPHEPGYYDRSNADKRWSDYDRTEHRGAYAPYGPDVLTYESSFQSKWMNVFVPLGKTGPADVRARLLTSDGQPLQSDLPEQP